MPRPSRPAHSATVTGTSRISRDMVRVTLSCESLPYSELNHTDHYVKLFFPPAGASYSWPFDPAKVREELPREEWPVTRTYTLRSWDADAQTVDIDFVSHGDTGLAGPWADAARPGDQIGFMGPGGAWHPDGPHIVFAGDEAAAPAIFAGIEALPQDATAEAWIEVADAEAHLPTPSHPGVAIHWVNRDGATHGTELVRAVTEAGVPSGDTRWFIHGVAEMIRDLRRFLFVENGVPKSEVSISGYWRLGMVEDEWQASKREFNEEIEASEAQAAANR
ncbi:siderophore-interacting protein [Corynebacterium sp. CNJ-954]|uniref:siderophore-interacting protein n=1 Tax=Corynebacterium sp. CNJ-954 TaxID=1904962 RepID=UPI000AE3405C|nr:siderophore-interacting protein [Corynebacterium sp. CNJ-954]